MTSSTVLDDPAADPIMAVDQVARSIEQVFAEVGGHHGAAHGIFAELNTGLDALSRELSGAGLAGASAALRDVVARLGGLADALPIETALLKSIGDIAGIFTSSR